MGLQLTLLNLWLRVAVKRKLARLRDPGVMRALMERDAGRYMVTPQGTHFVPDLIRPDGPGAAETLPATWASVGRPDRRKVILYLHGGAFLAGSARTHRHLAAALAQAAGSRAILPEYRLAPEHPFPAAVNDAEAAYRHLLEAGYAPEEIAVAGDSAGGGLAFALLLRCQARGLAPPACVVAFSPWVDLTGGGPSMRRNAARDVMLPAGRLREVVGYYADGQDPATPEMSPVFGRFESPPPAALFASRSEILMDDAVRLAEVLRNAGGDVQLSLWRRVPHAWPAFTGRIAEADRTLAEAGAFIARHLRADPPV